ncbi:hypothetical protein [Sulfurospirillum deleyianum]|uniref:Uncharacterized protein n=1 Tax=Sulfurospirillum deleyianum (strain ATCC 51133 / DSM 6946 / 5175) TaxID=525898 RepID=D1AZM2_SULD5|nr:hypothetical protein [Sulfurospirillum deleyianum]ACZ11489.1 hypothetical protein Sdel_0452 [Sulfurospirillum deleyianum DSM 6946]
MEAVKISWFLRDCYPEGTSDEEILQREAELQRTQDRNRKLFYEAKEYLKRNGSGFKEFTPTDYVHSLTKQKQIYDAYCKALDPKHEPINIRETLGLDEGIPHAFEDIQELAYHAELFFKTIFNVDLEPREIGALACEANFKAYFEEGCDYLEDRVKRYKENLTIMEQAFINEKKIKIACEVLDTLGVKHPRELERAKYVIDNFQANQKRKLLIEILNVNFPFITQTTVLNKIYESSLQ